MDREMTVQALMCLLEREIEERRALIGALKARMGDGPQPTRTMRRMGIGAAAVDVLREAGRPMHGLHEILPALKGRGFDVGRRGGFASVVLRTGQIERTAPGTYALKPARDVAGS